MNETAGPTEAAKELNPTTILARNTLGRSNVTRETFDKAYQTALSEFMQLRFNQDITETADFMAFWHLKETVKICRTISDALTAEDNELHIREITKCEIICESLNNLAMKL